MIPKACTRWEFPEVRGTLFWGLDNKDYLGYYIRVPIVGNSEIVNPESVTSNPKPEAVPLETVRVKEVPQVVHTKFGSAIPCFV